MAAELWAFRHLLAGLVRRELQVKYGGSVLGFLWSLLNPLLTLAVYTLAFKIVLRVRIPGGYSFSAIFFCAFLPWLFLSQSLTQATTSVVESANLVKKIYFPREVLPLAMVLSNVVQFLLTFIVLFPVLLALGARPTDSVLVLPLLVVLQTFFVSGLALILAAWNVTFRDTKHLVEVAIQLWFWLTPVVYVLDPKVVPELLVKVLAFNPMSAFMGLYRWALMDYPAGWTDWPVQLAFAFGAAAVSFWVGVAVFGRLSPRFAEVV